MLRIGIFAVGMAMSACACAQLTDRERSGIADALFLANLEQSDLVKARTVSGSDWLRNLANDPALGVGQLDEFRNAAGQRNVAQLLGLIRSSVYAEPATGEPGQGSSKPSESRVSPGLRFLSLIHI